MGQGQYCGMAWILLFRKDARPSPSNDKIRGIAGMHIDPKEGHPDMDYAEHMGTYNVFCSLTKWSTLIIVAIVAAMAIFLT